MQVVLPWAASYLGYRALSRDASVRRSLQHIAFGQMISSPKQVHGQNPAVWQVAAYHETLCFKIEIMIGGVLMNVRYPPDGKQGSHKGMALPLKNARVGNKGIEGISFQKLLDEAAMFSSFSKPYATGCPDGGRVSVTGSF